MNIGFAITGSFCTINDIFPIVEQLAKENNVIPITSENVFNLDTRFIKAPDTIFKLESITGNSVIHTIVDAEPIGPKNLLDILIIAPCTGNTLAKIANSITDTTVSLAAKAHLRNNAPILLGISTNDGLSGSAINLAKLLNKKNIYFVPFGQDDCIKKTSSLVADFTLVKEAMISALDGKQIQPILI